MKPIIIKSQCSECRFYSQYYDKDSGECLRYPPTALYDFEGQFRNFFPDTRSNRWCGEFQPVIDETTE